MKKVSILGVVGSLRRASYNRSALKAAQELVPKGLAALVRFATIGREAHGATK
jgi:NAD(P)H-dependent FMN reductase